MSHDRCCPANYNALLRQLRALDRFKNNPGLWHGLLERLVAEEVGAVGDLHEVEDGRSRIALLSDDRCEPPVPVVAGEIIVRSDSNEGLTAAADLLRELGFEPADKEGNAAAQDQPVHYEEAQGLVIGRFQATRREVDLLAAIDAINGLAPDGQRVAAAPNSLRAMNVVTKSKSGAEPACCHPEWLQVEDVEDAAGPPPTVIVLDTGKFLDGHREDWLEGVGGHPDPRTDPGGYLNLSAGHGTFIAGVIRQVCREASIEVRKVISAAGFVKDSDLAAAIARAGKDLPESGGVINLSLGSEDFGDVPPPEIERTLNGLPEKVIVVAAAGNTDSGKKVYPAAFSETHKQIVAVASLDGAGSPSTWSNRGDWVTFSAIGEGIVSTYLEGNERRGSSADDDPYDPEPDVWVGPKPWAVWTGTSFAVPQVSACLAKILTENPELNATDAVQELKQRIGEGSRLPGFGFPLPPADNLFFVQEPTRDDDGPQP